MATAAEWATGYARQARADFDTFNALQPQGAIPDCHKLLFLQMTSEKLAKAHLCSGGHDPAPLQTSHAFVAAILPRVLRQELAILKPLDWSFSPSQLLLLPAGRTFLRLVQLAINRLLI